ncbi:unnamed protein product, partial [Prorocentrum cordatum]
MDGGSTHLFCCKRPLGDALATIANTNALTCTDTRTHTHTHNTHNTHTHNTHTHQHLHRKRRKKQAEQRARRRLSAAEASGGWRRDTVTEEDADGDGRRRREPVGSGGSLGLGARATAALRGLDVRAHALQDARGPHLSSGPNVARLGELVPPGPQRLRAHGAPRRRRPQHVRGRGRGPAVAGGVPGTAAPLEQTTGRPGPISRMWRRRRRRGGATGRPAAAPSALQGPRLCSEPRRGWAGPAPTFGAAWGPAG